MDPNAAHLLSTQLTLAAAGAYFLQLLQKWSKTPWITAHTTHITVLVRAGIAFCSTIGIHMVWNGPANTLVITGLSLTTIGIGLWHFFTLYAMQHGWGQLFNVGTLQKINTPVEITSDKSPSK